MGSFAEQVIRSFEAGRRARLEEQEQARREKLEELAQQDRKAQMEHLKFLEQMSKWQAAHQARATLIGQVKAMEGMPGEMKPFNAPSFTGMPGGGGGLTGSSLAGAYEAPHPPVEVPPIPANPMIGQPAFPGMTLRPRNQFEMQQQGMAQTRAEAQARAEGTQAGSVFPLPINLMGVKAGTPVTEKAAEILGMAYKAQESAKDRASSDKGYFTPVQDPETGAIIAAFPSKPNIGTDGKIKLVPVDNPAGLSRSRNPLLGDMQRSALSLNLGAIHQVKVVEDEMAKLPTMGPIWGRIKTIAIENIGGAGATPEEIRLGITLRTFIRDQAFANGGKQLTPTEKEEYTAVLPKLSDTPEKAIAGARRAREILQDSMANKLKAIPPVQWGQIHPDFWAAANMPVMKMDEAFKAGTALPATNSGQVVDLVWSTVDGKKVLVEKPRQ